MSNPEATAAANDHADGIFVQNPSRRKKMIFVGTVLALLAMVIGLTWAFTVEKSPSQEEDTNSSGKTVNSNTESTNAPKIDQVDQAPSTVGPTISPVELPSQASTSETGSPLVPHTVATSSPIISPSLSPSTEAPISALIPSIRTIDPTPFTVRPAISQTQLPSRAPVGETGSPSMPQKEPQTASTQSPIESPSPSQRTVVELPITLVPTAPPTSGGSDTSDQISSSDLLLCDPSIQCMTDRWGNNQRLEVGQSMCNLEWRFGVAMLETGVGALIWQDCNIPTTLILQNVTSVTDQLAFQMTESGVFQVWDGNSLAWSLSSIYDDIQLYPRCLNSRPVIDCPYLHLRQRGGNIVLNYIPESAGWQAQKVHKSYPNLFPPDFS